MLMVQANTQVPMKTSKVKGPPPVPPRPNRNVVAEALAKTRRAAESRGNSSKTQPKETQKVSSKSKTLDRSSSVGASAIPKQNGLARVKSFIRDVISDRGSSSDERKSSGQNSRRSSSDSNSVPPSSLLKKSNESLNSKAVKTCKQILVRSLSTSNKLDQDSSKCKVTKSSSFAEKTIPVRKAPPPPLSPKPKLKPMKPTPLRYNSLERRMIPKQSPEISPYSSPVDAKKTPELPTSEAPYATVDEVITLNERLHTSPIKQGSVPNTCDTPCKGAEEISIPSRPLETNNNSLERKTSRVTEMLISEIMASRNINKNESNAVIDKGKGAEIELGEPDLDSIPKDMNNHEILIYELQSMRSQSSVPDILDAKELIENNNNDTCDSEESEPNYAMSSESSGQTDDSDQLYAYILDDHLKFRLRKQFRAISTMSLQGLPPLPKSLSGFAEPPSPETPSPPTKDSHDKPPSDLDGQLAYLKKEMASLRQLDLSLLSELWSLSEAMAAWRRQLERGMRLRPAPPPPPPPHYLRS